jgi:hypothetical protein
MTLGMDELTKRVIADAEGFMQSSSKLLPKMAHECLKKYLGNIWLNRKQRIVWKAKQSRVQYCLKKFSLFRGGLKLFDVGFERVTNADLGLLTKRRAW